MNHRIYLRQLLYSLKREYGQPLAVYNMQVTSSADVTTGQKHIRRIKYPIARAVVLPVSFNTAFLFTQAYLKSLGREFAFGGILDKDIKNVLIDGRDLPAGVEILPEFEIVLDHRRYELGRVQKLEGGFGYLVQMKRVTGTPANELQATSTYQSIRLTQQAVGSTS